MGLIRLTDPVDEPVTLAEAKLWVREETSDNDDLITSLIKVARENAENYCNRAIPQASFKLTLDQFPPQIKLPMPRVASITNIYYRDVEGTLTLLDSAGYTLDNANMVVNWVYPAVDYEWPDTWDAPNGVEVTYVAGFAAGAIPEALKLWMKLMVGGWYDTRAGFDISPLPMNSYELPPSFLYNNIAPWVVPAV